MKLQLAVAHLLVVAPSPAHGGTSATRASALPSACIELQDKGNNAVLIRSLTNAIPIADKEKCATTCSADRDCAGVTMMEAVTDGASVVHCWHRRLANSGDNWLSTEISQVGVQSVEMTAACRNELTPRRTSQLSNAGACSKMQYEGNSRPHIRALSGIANMEECALTCSADPNCDGVTTMEGTNDYCWHRKQGDSDGDWSSTSIMQELVQSVEMTSACRTELTAKRTSQLSNAGACSKMQHEGNNAGLIRALLGIANMEECALTCSADPNCDGVTTMEGENENCWHRKQGDSGGDWSSMAIAQKGVQAVEMTSDCRTELTAKRTSQLSNAGACSKMQHEGNNAGLIRALSGIANMEECALTCSADPNCGGVTTMEGTNESCWHREQGNSGGDWSSMAIAQKGVQAVEMTSDCRTELTAKRTSQLSNAGACSKMQYEGNSAGQIKALSGIANMEECALTCSTDPNCDGVTFTTMEGTNENCWHRECSGGDWSSTSIMQELVQSVEMTIACREELLGILRQEQAKKVQKLAEFVADATAYMVDNAVGGSGTGSSSSSTKIADADALDAAVADTTAAAIEAIYTNL